MSCIPDSIFRVQEGNTVRTEGVFRNVTNSYAPYDPIEVYVTVMDPAGDEFTWQYNVDSQVTRTGIGTYVALVPVGKAGTWHFRWWCQDPANPDQDGSTEECLRVLDAVTY